MRGRGFFRLFEGALNGDPVSLLIVGGLVVGLLAWGMSVGRKRRREKAEREREWAESVQTTTERDRLP